MGERESEVSRVEGWDQEKGEGFERITCPACGYCVTVYEHGDTVVWRDRDPTCSCCSDVDLGTSSDDASWSYNSSEEEGGCGLALFGLLFLGIGLIVLLANALG